MTAILIIASSFGLSFLVSRFIAPKSLVLFQAVYRLRHRDSLSPVDRRVDVVETQQRAPAPLDARPIINTGCHIAAVACLTIMTATVYIPPSQITSSTVH